MKTFLLVVLTCLLPVALLAQQDPLYAQYFNNPMLINPAFAGSNDRFYAGLGYRSQWNSIEGAPTTFNFNSHMAVMDNKVGVGVIFTSDQLGESKTTNYGGAFSYRIALPNATFSFGMRAGFVQYQANMKGVQVLNPDPLFVPYSATRFNTGAGVLLKGLRYTLGLSVPHLLPNNTGHGPASDQNYYLFARYSFYLSERIDFGPSILLRLTKGAPLSADLNLNFTFNKLYTAGLFVRNLNTYGLLLQIVVKNARFGYVFELPGKNSALNFTSHEVSLALSLDVLRSHDHSSVRF
jgi:type IX secretion system PorP/SprF family membrane protein